MAVADDAVIELRTTGNDNNGGGFVAGGSGTDFSQQDAAQLALTDLVTSGIGVVTVTSVTGGFTAAMIDNFIQIRSGTNVTAGFYQIITRVDTNTITVDRAPDDGVGGISGGSGDVGGALASPGQVANCIDNQAIGDCVVHIETGTYTLTSSSANISGGRISITTSGAAAFWKGYNSARDDLESTADTTNNPIFDAGAITSITVVGALAHAVDSRIGLAFHITVDGQDNSSVVGFSGTDDNRYIACKALDCPTGFGTGTRGGCFYCYADSCATTGFNDIPTYRCVARGCGIGFRADNPSFRILDLAYNCTSQGFFSDDDHGYYYGCVSVDNTDDGFRVGDPGNTSFVNCVAAFNGGWGFGASSEDEAGGSVMVQCATFSNTSGAVEFTGTAGFRQIDTITLSADPFTNRASDDYNLNNTSGGGADLRNAAFQLATQTDEFDIGALQHIESVGGGGGASAQLIYPYGVE